MKRLLISGALLSLMACNAAADVTVTLPAKSGVKQVVVTATTLASMNSARSRADLVTHTDTIQVKGNKITIKLDAEPSRYQIQFNEQDGAGFFATAGENINVTISSMSPFKGTVSGTPLMDGIEAIDAATEPITQEYNVLQQNGQMNEENHARLVSAYNNIILNYITNNPNSPAACYAITNLSGEEFLKAYDLLGEGARKSILYPTVEKNLEGVKRQIEQEKAIKEMQSGNVMAPNFTLKDMQGKDVSLSDFRGKWVVLDFWGAWCKWCIKGFPALKEAYANANGAFEVIGIDNRDTVEAWKAAVERYQLPWVNVYNPRENERLTEEYQISGFPTKIIVNPEGKIANITVGEEPAFFDTLAKLMGK